MEMDHGGAGARCRSASPRSRRRPRTCSRATRSRGRTTARAPHTVTADDGSVRLGRAGRRPTFHMRFDDGRRGALLLPPALVHARRDRRPPRCCSTRRATRTTAPGAPVRVRRALGAARRGTDVRIEADRRRRLQRRGATTVADDGTFKATVHARHERDVPRRRRRRRQPAGALLVLDRTVTATASTKARRATVRARVTPASPGATVVLQLRLRERFGWWPVARAQGGPRRPRDARRAGAAGRCPRAWS